MDYFADLRQLAMTESCSNYHAILAFVGDTNLHKQGCGLIPLSRQMTGYDLMEYRGGGGAIEPRTFIVAQKRTPYFGRIATVLGRRKVNAKLWLPGTILITNLRAPSSRQQGHQ